MWFLWFFAGRPWPGRQRGVAAFFRSASRRCRSSKTPAQRGRGTTAVVELAAGRSATDAAGERRLAGRVGDQPAESTGAAIAWAALSRNPVGGLRERQVGHQQHPHGGQQEVFSQGGEQFCPTGGLSILMAAPMQGRSWRSDADWRKEWPGQGSALADSGRSPSRAGVCESGLDAAPGEQVRPPTRLAQVLIRRCPC